MTAAERPAGWMLGALALPLVALAFTFLLPLLWLLRMSLTTSSVEGALGAGFSVAAYRTVLGDGFFWWVAWRTVCLGLMVTGIALPLSFPIALFLARTQSRWRGVLVALAVAPLLTSTVIRTYGWMVILGRHGAISRGLMRLGLLDRPLRIDNGTTATVIALVEILMPYAILAMLAGFGRLSRDLEQAAALLGADGWRVFSRVTLPLGAPGILTASLLVFVLSISALVTPQLLGGGRVFLLSTEIFSQTTIALNWPVAGALSVLLLALFGCVITLYQRLLASLEGTA